MRIKKYLSPTGVLNKKYADKDFEGIDWYYIPRSDIKSDDKLLDTALKLEEEYYLAGENNYLLPSNRKGGRLIPRKYGIGGYVTDLLGLNKEGSFLTKMSSKLGELASKAEKPLSYLNVLSPTSVAGAVGRKIMGNPEPIMNLIRKGTGITTSAFSEAHPIASLALNLGLDFVTDPFTLVGSIGKINQAGKIGKAAVRVANKTEMLTHLSKLLTTSAVTPERQRLWKCLMYITNGRPSEGFKLAKARLSGDELSDMLKYVLTGDAQAFSRLKPGYTGFIEKGRKPEIWYERYTTASPSSNEIELTDLTLGIVDSKVNVPALYEQLSKASPLLSKDLAINIRGGEIIGTKQAIKNLGLLKMLNGEDVPLGIIPIVADNYQSGVRALQRLNNETPIMSYSLRTHLIKTAKRGQKGMFNTAGMHCYIYADEKGKLRLVEADIFKNTASGVTKKYSGIFEGSSIKNIGKRIALNRYNGAELTGVVILREKRLETNDLINALALLEKRIYEGRSALKQGDITENDFLTLRAETSKTEDLLREMLMQQNPKYYLLNLTEVNSRSRKLIGKADKKGHWVTSEDAHIESTIDKIIETLKSKHELTRLSTDRNRIRKIVTQAMEIGENLSRLKRAVFTSLIETPETVNPRLKAMFRTVEPEKYAKASKLNKARKFSDSPQDNIVFLFSEGKTYVPKTLDFNSKNNVDNQIKNTIYAIQNYSTSDPKSRELITKAIDEGFTLFDPEKMKSPETFYNTLKECKQLFSDKLSELVPNVDKKISSNLHRSQKLISELPNTLKLGGKLTLKNDMVNKR